MFAVGGAAIVGCGIGGIMAMIGILVLYNKNKFVLPERLENRCL